MADFAFLPSTLPEEIRTLVFFQLDHQSLCRLSSCSRAWRVCVDSDVVWKAKATELGLTELPPGEATWKGAFRSCRTVMVGDAIEVLDTVNEWSIARVVAVLGGRLGTVHAATGAPAHGDGANADFLLVKFEAFPDSEPMWLHASHDRYRFRALTAKGVNTALANHRAMDEEEFAGLRRTVEERLRGGESAWGMPRAGRSASCWPALYSRNSQVGVRVVVPDVVRWKDSQVVRGPFRKLDVLRDRLATRPPIPPPLHEPGVWASEVLRFSSQYNESTWGAAQATGPPKVYPAYGDIYGAWAPRPSRGTPEFLELKFPKPVHILQMHIYETYNPGAVVSISVHNGREFVQLWSGQPSQRLLPQASRIFIPEFVPKDFATDLIRIDLDTSQSQSWSEIDAVRVFGEEEEVPQRPLGTMERLRAMLGGLRL